MSANQFRRSSDTILEEVFHFSNEASLVKFKIKYAQDLQNCISVQDDSNELLYVVARFDVITLLMEDFKQFTLFGSRGDSSLSVAHNFIDIAIVDLKREGFANSDIMHYLMASLSQKLNDDNEREHITDTSGSLFDNIANAIKPGKVQDDRELIFHDVKGNELKAGDLVELFHLEDFLHLRNEKVGDVLIVVQTEDLATNFIYFKNIRTSNTLAAFGHEVKLFIQ